ncbi:protein NRT1/ PTR FAMILY 6.2 [Sesamum alatum]|uniref:Protein NRT1/ PTR FAMILY 6.2 n=1 Tax=Sesamum alatum TaxID=300844 RepID=A0AAE1XYN7_9LAMI|nr:protein NRT1/ PTR FAMILY 6.2 [Sesamum alatum]
MIHTFGRVFVLIRFHQFTENRDTDRLSPVHTGHGCSSEASSSQCKGNTAMQPQSAFLLILQFLLQMGCGEAFIYTGQLDFFITQSPKGMKIMRTGLLLFLTGLSLSSLLVSIAKKVTPTAGAGGQNQQRDGALDCFYGLLAILSSIKFWLFLLCAKWYR